MKYNFITYPTFDRELKRLAKKYLSLKQDILALIQEIERNPYAGTDLGNNIYKYRLSIASKGKGKSGGEGRRPHQVRRAQRDNKQTSINKETEKRVQKSRSQSYR